MQRRIWVVLVSGLLASVGAFGQQIEFGIDSTTGTYSYNSSTSDDLTTDQSLTVDSITSTGNPDNPAMSITDASLSFTTGSATGLWSWGNGGTLTLSGCVDVTNGCNGGDVIFDATFASAEIVYLGPSMYQIALGSLSGDISTGVAQALGVGTGFTTSALNLDIEVPGGTLSGGTFTDAQTDPTGTNSFTVYTQPTTVEAPEDWSIFSTLGIFAFGFAVFGVVHRLGLIKAVGF